jgi:Tfp pilus assembly protein PilN
VRPVNLIPSEDRVGARRPMRGGPLAYIVIGALVGALVGLSVLVVTGNQISNSKAEVVQLEQQTAAVEAKAHELDAYTQFHSVREQRTATIVSLADSRFDWERVMRELSLVLPGDVWLTNLTGSASPTVTPDGASSISLRAAIPGPALELVGCARSQDAVAGFVQTLKEIDGVTRVGVQASSLGAGPGAEGGTETTSDCQTHKFIAQFQIVVAFDAAPVAAETGAPSAEVPATPEEAAPSAETTSTEGEG